jgi:outer membrane protein OmpA-like peptidoglycan-associated protein
MKTPLRVGLAVLTLLAGACSPGASEPVPGPDKQGAGTVYGAVVGAGTGAVTGAQLSAATGPGAWVGAGLGGVFGMVSGIGVDLLEEDQLQRKEEFRRLRLQAWAQEVLQEHYERRLAVHPSRDIFPADLFFEPGSAKLKPEGQVLIHELAQLSKTRSPWSRMLITSYLTSANADSPFASSINEKRADELGLHFVRCGVEARRVVTQGVVLDSPLVQDPDDHPSRYRQAIEFLPLDN